MREFYPTFYDRTISTSTAGNERKIDIYSEEAYHTLGQLWIRSSWQHRIYSHFTWMGMPIAQLPEDMFMMQELIFQLRPDVIIETGTWSGGSAIFYASLLELMGTGKVITIDIQQPNRQAIQDHPMNRRIVVLEGSSVDQTVLRQVKAYVSGKDRVLVVLDSDHSYAHVYQEMGCYAPLVTNQSYLVVMDGVMQILRDAPNALPTWETDNPLAAIRDFLKHHEEFEVDPHYNKVPVTYCPNAFLRNKGSSGQ